MSVMTVIELEAFGSLKMKKRPMPAPGPGQALVRMHAASLNYRDLLMIKGGYGSTAKPPFVPVSDGAGEVVAVGPGVNRVAAGDKVVPSFFQGWLSGEPRGDRVSGALGGPLDGALAEYALFDAQGLCRFPDHLSYEEAACLPCAGLTAWSAVVSQGNTEPGDIVLTQGSGGVSIFALQFAKLMGCRVIATTSSEDKAARLKALGADHVINYKTEPDWARAARRLAGPLGVDHVIEIGGSGTLAQSVKATRFGGQISLIGVVAGASGEFNVALIVMNNMRLQGVTVGSRDQLQDMIDAIALARLKPQIDTVFAWDKLEDAMAHMGAGRHFGKVCIKIA